MKKITTVFLFLFIAALTTPTAASAMTAERYFRLAKKHKSINPFGATVQSAHETGEWTSSLWKEGYNGAGIKANKAWRASGKPCIVKNSKESTNGVYHTKASYFRKYKSPAEFLSDYAVKIRDEYPRCARNHDNMWGYFAGFYHGKYGKWATDHNYYLRLTVKAIKIAPDIYGKYWKGKLLKDYRIAVQRKSLEAWQKTIIEKQFSAVGINAKLDLVESEAYAELDADDELENDSADDGTGYEPPQAAEKAPGQFDKTIDDIYRQLEEENKL